MDEYRILGTYLLSSFHQTSKSKQTQRVKQYDVLSYAPDYLPVIRTVLLDTYVLLTSRVPYVVLRYGTKVPCILCATKNAWQTACCR